jgi:threonine dehydratase
MIELKNIQAAAENLKQVILQTPCAQNFNFSDKYQANIFLKREDLQVVRSYKIRGAYTKISSLDPNSKAKGIVCASAGNHAQGVALSCKTLGIKGVIVMPATTPKQKVKQVELFGKEFVEIVLVGDTFDDAFHEAKKYCETNQKEFIHPFDDQKVITGQGTVGLEIFESIKDPLDYVFVPIGGGGLAAGICSVFSQLSPNTKIIGVEPAGANSMQTSIKNSVNTTLETIDKFVDGAAVKRVGDQTFKICKDYLSDVIPVPEGKVCTTILSLYNEEAMVVEPAGALTIAALDFYKKQIKGKNVVCIVSGSNNDITRTEEIKERSLFYEGLKHYFLIQFPQRPGALKAFVSEVLGPDDDITYFQFSKKNSRESGPAVVGIELKNKEDLDSIKAKMQNLHFAFEYLNDNLLLYSQLIG